MKILKQTVFAFSIDDEDKPKKNKKLKRKEKEIKINEDSLPKLADVDVVYDYMIVNFNKKNKNEKKNIFQYNEKNCLLTSSVFKNNLKDNNLKTKTNNLKNSVLMNKKAFNKNRVKKLNEKYLNDLIYIENPPKKLKKILEDFKIKKKEENILNLEKKEKRYNKIKNNSKLVNYQSKKKMKDSEVSHALEYFKTIQQLLKIEKENDEEESIFTKKKSIKNTVTDFNINEFKDNSIKNEIFFEENEVSADEFFLNTRNNEKYDDDDKNIDEIESIKTESDIEELECSFEIVEKEDIKIKPHFNDYNLDKLKKKKILQFYKEEEKAAFSIPKKNNFLEKSDIKKNVNNDLDFIFSDINSNNDISENFNIEEKCQKKPKNIYKKKTEIVEKSKNSILKNKLAINSLKKELDEIKKINNFFRNFK